MLKWFSNVFKVEQTVKYCRWYVDWLLLHTLYLCVWWVFFPSKIIFCICKCHKKTTLYFFVYPDVNLLSTSVHTYTFSYVGRECVFKSSPLEQWTVSTWTMYLALLAPPWNNGNDMNNITFKSNVQTFRDGYVHCRQMS